MVARKIGLAGKSGSGKDVAADYICQRYGYTKIAVADAIRDECAEFLRKALAVQGNGMYPNVGLNKVIPAMTAMVYEKPTPSGIRVLLQWYGTEFKRAIYPMYWVDRLKERMAESDSVVISDVRTPDEMEVVRSVGGEIWFVERPGVGSVGIPGHYTEVALDGAQFEHTIQNDGTLEEFENKIDWIFQNC